MTSPLRLALAGAALAGLALPLTAQGGLHAQGTEAGEAPAVVDSLHGTPVPDPFRWLEDLDSPETGAWVRARDSVARRQISRLPGHGTLLRRLRTLAKGERLQAPVPAGGRIFYRVADVTGTARVGIVMKACERCPAVLLVHSDSLGDSTLTLATGAATGAFFEPSPDGRHLIYGTSRRGSTWAALRVLEVAGRRTLPDSLPGVRGDAAVAWHPDGSGFFFARHDPPPPGAEQRAAPGLQRVSFHRLGTPHSADELAYRREDRPGWRYRPAVTADRRHLVITVADGSAPGGRILFRDLGRPEPVRELIADDSASFDFAGGLGSELLLLSTRGAPRGQLIAVRPGPAGEPPAVRVVVPESRVTLTAAQRAGDRLLVQYLDDAYPRAAVYSLRGARQRQIDLPDGLIAWSGYRAEAERPEVLASLSGAADPGTIYRIDLAAGAVRVIARPRLAFDPDDFVTRRAFYSSHDGTRVPMFLVHRRDLPSNAAHPTWLFAYGAFNFSAFPWFQM